LLAGRLPKRSEAALTPPLHRSKLSATMPTGFDEAFRGTKELAANIRANRIDALVYHLYLPCRSYAQAGALTPAEIKIVEGAAK